MKQISLSFALLVCAVVFVTACKKDDPEPAPTGPGQPQSGPFSATIDGQSFVPNQFSIQYMFDGIGINTGGGNYLLHLFLVPDSLSAGSTYSFMDPQYDHLLSFRQEDTVSGAYFYPESGSITITENNTTANTLKATFSLVAKDMSSDSTHTFTNGQLNIMY